MADLGGEFDASKVEPAEAFTALPAGKYIAVMVKNAWKDTKKKNGQMLSLTFQVISGKFKNRLLFANLNLKNPSQQAVYISRRELSAICHAVGVLKAKDCDQLHKKPLTLEVAVSSFNGNATNEIKGYSPAKRKSTAAPAIEPAETKVVGDSDGSPNDTVDTSFDVDRFEAAAEQADGNSPDWLTS